MLAGKILAFVVFVFLFWWSEATRKWPLFFPLVIIERSEEPVFFQCLQCLYIAALLFIGIWIGVDLYHKVF